MSPLHPIQRRWFAEDLVRLRRSDERRRYSASQRRGRIDPNPHQIDAVIFALRRIPEGGCILADEVGLGKTIEAGLVISQLMAEGMSRILLVVPKTLLGQWRQELYDLFGIDSIEGSKAEGAFDGAGVFLVGREWAGEQGSDALRMCEPFDLCVIDEAHELFSAIYKRFDRDGVYQPNSPHAQRAGRIRELLGATPVLLLTATPIQNSLAELWGLVQYVEPSGTLLGNLKTFRQVFCDGNDRKLVDGRDHELRTRIATVCQRTLRRQAQEFLERPFVARRAQLFRYRMTAEELALYESVTEFLMQPRLAAFRGNQRRLLIISFHRQMASSLRALAISLEKIAARLRRMIEPRTSGPGTQELLEIVESLEEEVIDTDVDDGAPPQVSQIRTELAAVEELATRARSLPIDSKATALIRAVNLVFARSKQGDGSGKVVIFTESIATQDYLCDILTGKDNELGRRDITVFRGTNSGERASQALTTWRTEVEASIPKYNRPSRSVALRMALVHEFETKTKIFISTEAGAKGLNLQFCDTIINYDLPWNPQRIEQRIGRCHRYGQANDVTVINFLAADNEAQQLTFEILGQKLDLFGTILDASDAVLHQPSTSTPETLASAMAVELEDRMKRIYEDARSNREIVEELRSLRDEIGDDRATFESELDRTASLIESRFDEKVRSVFRRLRDELPATLAELDHDLERVVCAYLEAVGADYERLDRGEFVLLTVQPNSKLETALDAEPEGDLTLTVGQARESTMSSRDCLHLGHPLVSAAVAEAREATEATSTVQLDIDENSSSEVLALKGRRAKLVLIKVKYRGFETSERLLPVVIMDPDGEVLSDSDARRLLGLRAAEVSSPVTFELTDEDLEDAVEEAVFVDQGKTSARDQLRFERSMAQIDRAIEDRILVLEQNRLSVETKLKAERASRDSALNSTARTRSESRIRDHQALQTKIEQEIESLVARHDDGYQQQRARAHRRRYAAPTIDRLLVAELVFR